jgi:arsenate reductase
MKIWFNPACSKCLAATAALDEAGIDYSVRRYLDEPPTVNELRDVLARLGLEPWDVARTGEPAAEEVGLASFARDDASRERWLEAMAAQPSLIQRPILTAEDGTTVVGRDRASIDRVIDAEQ